MEPPAAGAKRRYINIKVDTSFYIQINCLSVCLELALILHETTIGKSYQLETNNFLLPGVTSRSVFSQCINIGSLLSHLRFIKIIDAILNHYCGLV